MGQSMRPLVLPLAATVVTVAWLFTVPVANTQTRSPSPGPSESPKNIPDQKLDAAAAALEQVASVKEDYQRRIKAADPSDRVDRLRTCIDALRVLARSNDPNRVF